jgi:hypothetical protein
VRPKRKKEKELEASNEAARPAPSAPAEESKGAPEVIEVAGGVPSSLPTGPKSLTGGTRV